MVQDQISTDGICSRSTRNRCLKRHLSRRFASPLTKRGLLEWRVSTQAVTSFLGRLPQDNWLEVSYSAFVADPLGTSERLKDFLHLTPEQTVRDFIQQNVRRYSESRDGAELTQLELVIGGPLLEQSVKPLRSRLTTSGDRKSVPRHLG